MIKLTSLTLFCFIGFYSSAQMSLQDVEDDAIRHRIELAKVKTDSFLLTPFKGDVRSKFKFEFTRSKYMAGEAYGNYILINSGRPSSENFDAVQHFYSFRDKTIHLETDLTVWFWSDRSELSKTDSLKFEALNSIYNKGLLQKVKAMIVERKLKYPYTMIYVNSKEGLFEIILKDKVLPHNYFIR